MKLNRALLTNGVPFELTDSIDFSSYSFDPTHIRSIDSCDVKVKATDYESILRIEVEINTQITGVCSYTLEDVPLTLKLKDELDFSDDENDEDCYYEKSSIIDLDEYILGIILANVPIRIVKKGAKLPNDGKNYRVLSQEDYEKEKSESVDHRWDKLDSVKISDDE